jgi:hypothetical protein
VNDSPPPAPRQIVRRAVLTPIDRATAPLASSRAVLVVLGFWTVWLAHTTRVSTRLETLPTRDVCVVALWAAGIIGIGHLFRDPNRITMGVFGLMLMLNAFLRMVGFGWRTWRDVDHSGWYTTDVWRFFEGSTAVPVWGIIGFFGFLIWRRRNNITVGLVSGGGEGARDAP